MPVSSYGGSTDSLASPSLSSWAASVSSALDASDTTVNTRITQRVLPLTAKTGNYTLTASDTVVTCNGTLTITLPTAVGLTGKQFIIRNIATNTVTIARTSSQTIDGCSGTITLAGKGSMAVVSDGANWLVVSGEYSDESIGRRIFTWSSSLANGATTGWQMTYGDTGLRNIAASVTGSSIASCYQALIRREGSFVFLYIDYTLTATPTSGHSAYTLPSGFRPQGDPYGLMRAYNAGANPAIVMNSSTGDINVYNGAANAGYKLSGTWPTTNSWPSSLPGSASGSVPTA